MVASIVRVIALALVFALLALSRTFAEAGSIPGEPGARTLRRSIASATVGYAWDYGSGQGIFTTTRGLNFIKDSPFYYGFGSVSGWFFSTGESFAETCLFAGWNGPAGGGAEVDAFLSLVPTGARIEPRDGRLVFRPEGPAIQPSLGICVPVSVNVDVSISSAPMIRPYDLQSGTWGLSRSYLTLSASARIKLRELVEKRPWNDG